MGANDLDDGDSGIDGRAIRRKAAPSVRGGKNKRKKTVQTYMGYEFDDNTADYNLDAIVVHIVTDGDSVYANQVRPPALPSHVRSLTPSLPLAGQDAQGSQALSMHVWEDFPPDVVWYETEANVDGTIAYEQYLEQQANDESEAAAAAQEEAELAEMEDEEDMPAP